MKRLFPALFFITFGLCMIIVVLNLSSVGDPHLPSYAGFISPTVPKQEVPQKAETTALYYNKNVIKDTDSHSATG